LIKKTQVAAIKLQPIKSAAMSFGENLNGDEPVLLPIGVRATKMLTQKINPQAQIVIVFRFIFSSIPLRPQSPA
jgi:hypothetical protein